MYPANRTPITRKVGRERRWKKGRKKAGRETSFLTESWLHSKRVVLEPALSGHH